MKIMVVGDVHGDWGYWPKYHGKSIFHNNWSMTWDNYGVKNPDTDIYWCDGNHEDHWTLAAWDYMKRGSTLELPDGRTVLFMGGANSIDRKYRRLGDDWFPEELITQRQVMELPKVNVDIIISHTCPE